MFTMPKIFHIRVLEDPGGLGSIALACHTLGRGFDSRPALGVVYVPRYPVIGPPACWVTLTNKIKIKIK